MNMYGFLENETGNTVDFLGLDPRLRPDGKPVKGKGHHIISVELWAEYGFTDTTACDCLDDATISTDSHGFDAHGGINGYTGQVDIEMSKEIEKYKKLNNIQGALTPQQQQSLAPHLVNLIRNSENPFIRGFNDVVPYGRGAVKTWQVEIGSDLIKGAKEADCYISKGGRRIPFVKYVLIVTTWTSIFNSQIAKGASPEAAAVVASADTISPLPLGIDDIEGGGDEFAEQYKNMIQSASDNAMFDSIIENGGYAPDGTQVLESNPFGF